MSSGDSELSSLGSYKEGAWKVCRLEMTICVGHFWMVMSLVCMIKGNKEIKGSTVTSIKYFKDDIQKAPFIRKPALLPWNISGRK